MAMKHEIEHGLSPELARKVIDKAMEAYGARFADYNPRYTWKSENDGELSFKAKGVSVTGDIQIRGSKIFVALEVPFLLRIFKGKAMKVIDSEVRGWVVKAKAGELD